jgi:hypothetical protein
MPTANTISLRGSLTDIPRRLADVRFTLKSRHSPRFSDHVDKTPSQDGGSDKTISSAVLLPRVGSCAACSASGLHWRDVDHALVMPFGMRAILITRTSAPL